MASGLVPLSEALKYGGVENLGRGVVETILEESPLIPRMNWVPFAGEAMKHEVEGTLPLPQFRNVNEGYSKTWGSDTEHYWGVSILGGEFGVDIFEENVVANQKSIMKKQAKKHAKANALFFDWQAIYGTGAVADKSFKGIRALVDEGWGQKLLNAAGGGALTLDKLDEAIDLMRNTGKPQEAWTTRWMRRKVTNLARTTVTGVSLIDTGTDTFGRKILMYDDIPFVLTGQAMKPDGTIVELLDFNEDPGDGGFDTESIWFVKHGEEDFTGILGRSGSMQARTFGELQSAPQYLARYEWYPGVAVLSPYSVVRLYGILKV